MKLDRFRDRFFAAAPRYRWIETIGRGGMGIVFKAHDLALDDVVAIKVLSPDLEVDEEELLVRFKREVFLNRKIKHPNVARMHDFGVAGDYPYITMEFVPGLDLRQLIRREGRLSPARAVSILRQICLGTDAAHRLGIIHRDLKSQNVVVDDSGAVAILDFGLARSKRAQERATLTSAVLGTPHYMSPEQALGREADFRSDIYSIGVIAFEALTGFLPFHGDSPHVVAMAHVREPVPDPTGLVPGLPADLVALVCRALAKDPSDRFPSASDLERGLSEVGLAPEPASGPPAEPGLVEAEELPSGLPTTRLREEPPPPPPADRTVPASGGRLAEVKSWPPVVLVVQPDAVERRLLTGHVSQFGCASAEAGSGQEALQRLLAEPPDLLLMDVKLPDMDGFDVVRILRSQAGSSRLPVLLLAPRLDRRVYAFALQSGATDVLGKPVDLTELVGRTWDLLQREGFLPPQDNAGLSEALKALAHLRSRTPSSGIRT